MKTITASPDIVLQLGRQGENNARQIVFDITDWKAEFGADGTVALLAQRPRETEPYPVDIVVSGSAVTWLVSAADTAKPGIYGQAELQYRIGDVVVKSAIWRTFVADSLGIPSPEPPEPQQAWVDQVLDAAQTVETATVNGPKIQGGTWWVWDFQSEAYVDTGVQAQGPAGTTQQPMHINLQDEYGIDLVGVLMLMLQSGQKEQTLVFPQSNAFFSSIDSASEPIWIDISLKSIYPLSPQFYTAPITGGVDDSGNFVWVDLKISVYLMTSAMSGWVAGYVGFNRGTQGIYIQITSMPGGA